MRLLALIVTVVFVAWGLGWAENSGTVDSRCEVGEARGFATIKPFPVNIAGQIPGSFTSHNRWFLRRYNCRGMSVEVRRLQTGVYDLRFPGLQVRTIAGVGLSESHISVGVQPLSNIVRVRLFQDDVPHDAAFSVVIY